MKQSLVLPPALVSCEEGRHLACNSQASAEWPCLLRRLQAQADIDASVHLALLRMCGGLEESQAGGHHRHVLGVMLTDVATLLRTWIPHFC